MDRTKKIKTAVVGVGAIGKNHARIYAELESTDLVGVFDENTDLAKSIAQEYGCEAFESLPQVAAASAAVSVSTPTVTHREIGSLLLEAGCHILVEKPIADSLDDARALIDLAQEKGCVLQVGHIERFNPVMSQLETHLDSPKFIESHRLSPFPNRSVDIGVVLDLMIHDLEIILHLVNSPIDSIDAVGIPVLTRREDIANARIRFKNGCVANITASRISPEQLRKIRVFQSDAYLSLDYRDQSGWIYRKDGMQIAREEVQVEKDEPLKCELASFADCAREGREPRVSGDEGAAALDVALEITSKIEQQNQSE